METLREAKLTTAEYRKTIYDLLSILQAFAPDADAQQKVTEMYNKIIQSNGYTKPAVRYMTNALYYGLTHGNWPW